MDEAISKVRSTIQRIRLHLQHTSTPSPPSSSCGRYNDNDALEDEARPTLSMNNNNNKEETNDQLLAVVDEAHTDKDDDDDDEMNEKDNILASSKDNDDGGNNTINDKNLQTTTNGQAEMVNELVNCLALLLIEMDRTMYHYNYAAAVCEETDDEDEDDGQYATMTTLGQKRKRITYSSSSNSNKSLLHYTPTIQHKAMDNNFNNIENDYENIKLSLQEGYSLLLQATSTTEKNIILSSLIKQLTAVKTSYCRHLLLIDIAPQFIHLPNTTTATSHNTTTSNSHQDNNIMEGLPDWLIDDNNKYDDTTTTNDISIIRSNRVGVGSTSTAAMVMNDTNNKSNISNEETEIQQLLLQAFAVIIHDDITIIPPFLSLLSNLFTTNPVNTNTNDNDEQITSLMMLLADTNGEEENYSAYDLGGVVDNDEDDTNDDDADDDASKNSSSRNNSNASITNTTASNSTTSSIKNVREFCFQLCLSVLSNYTLPSNTTTITRQQQQQQIQQVQNDLSCLLHSLFILVSTKREGQCVMIALRNVWKSVVTTLQQKQQQQQYNYGDKNHDTTSSTATDNNDHDLFSIGNIILQSILSSKHKLSKSRYLIYGYIFALGRELHCQKNGEETGGDDAKHLKQQLSLLDIIVLIALYTNLEYSTLIESIIDSLSNEQTLSLLQLILSLIQSWSLPPLSSSSNNNNNGRGCGQQKQQRKNSLLYERLASPLMSTLFFIMISCSSKVTTHDDDGTASSIVGSTWPSSILAVMYRPNCMQPWILNDSSSSLIHY
jgi:hypothetical protein